MELSNRRPRGNRFFKTEKLAANIWAGVFSAWARVLI